MTDSGRATAFSTADELAEHLAERAQGTTAVAGGSRSLLDILSPLFQRTGEIARSLAAADGRYAGGTAHDELKSLLERCERDAGQAGRSDADVEHAVLATVAWIDETISAALSDAAPDAEAADPEDPFGDPDAPDRESQELYRLQTTRFEISDAGVRFFEKLSGLTTEQHEVREVYVAALQHGFRGQYFAEDDRRQLDGIKREHAERLLTVTQRPQPQAATPEAPPAGHRAAQGGGRRRWMMVAATAAVVAIAGAFFAYDWYDDRSECVAMYGDHCGACKENPDNCFTK